MTRGTMEEALRRFVDFQRKRGIPRIDSKPLPKRYNGLAILYYILFGALHQSLTVTLMTQANIGQLLVRLNRSRTDVQAKYCSPKKNC